MENITKSKVEIKKIDEIVFMMDFLILRLTMRKESLINRHGMKTIK